MEPEEFAVLRKYADIRASLIRSTYGLSGLVLREIGIPRIEDGVMEWISAYDAEIRLAAHKAASELSRYEARIAKRLANVVPLPASYAACSDAQKAVLQLSQADYNRRFPVPAANVAGNEEEEEQ
jgi:hypothetical protein